MSIARVWRQSHASQLYYWSWCFSAVVPACILPLPPRRWLEDGKRIEIKRAPTYYGQLSATLESRVDTGQLSADIVFSGPDRPKSLVVRFRHPQARRMRSVRVNGRVWAALDEQGEIVRIDDPADKRYGVRAKY